MRKRRLCWVVIGVAVAGAAGCGSSSSSTSGIASQPPQTILNSTKAAANSLKSVHTAGFVRSNGQRINLDLHLVSGQGGRGRIAIGGLGFRLVRIGRYLYLSAPADVWRRTGAPPSAVRLLDGKWLRTPASGQFAPFAKLTDVHSLFAALLTTRTKPKTGATSTLAGRKVVALKGQHGTLYVAATGKPYPVEVVRTGSGGGKLDFDRFNEAVALNAPSGSVDLPQAGG